MPFSLDALKPSVLTDVGLSLLIIALLLAMRWLIVRQIRGGEETVSAERRKWISFVRNITLFLILAVLVAIWLLEITHFALSVAAISVALVLANKELILCMVGGIYRIIARPFDVNDWIEIESSVGEVLETRLLTTQLQELTTSTDAIVEYSGRVLVVPNAQLLSQTVNNFTYTKNFTTLSFQLVSPVDCSDPLARFADLNQHVAKVWEEHEELAVRYWRMLRSRTGVDFPDPTPSICLGTSSTGAATYDIRIYCQRKLAKEIRNQITQAFLSSQPD
jgi:small-conductance mechanosensitive channel